MWPHPFITLKSSRRRRPSESPARRPHLKARCAATLHQRFDEPIFALGQLAVTRHFGRALPMNHTPRWIGRSFPSVRQRSKGAPAARGSQITDLLHQEIKLRMLTADAQKTPPPSSRRKKRTEISSTILEDSFKPLQAAMWPFLMIREFDAESGSQQTASSRRA